MVEHKDWEKGDVFPADLFWISFSWFFRHQHSYFPQNLKRFALYKCDILAPQIAVAKAKLSFLFSADHQQLLRSL